MRKESILQINGKPHTLGRRTWIMGILNVTLDSFSDGGDYFDKEKAVQRGLELAAEGADIIDVGGESSRPGSDPISPSEELARVIPVIKSLREKTEALISIDTTKADVAEAALEAGADIINDISALRFDDRMSELAAKKSTPVVIMHMKGTPKDMQTNPHYDDLLGEIRDFFQERIETAESQGINKKQIILDPGIGFGKRLEDNLRLLRDLEFLEEFQRPILIGTSRKSFIGHILNLPPKERVEGTIASSVVGMTRGAHILRVHDVASVFKAANVADAILHQNNMEKENQNDQ